MRSSDFFSINLVFISLLLLNSFPQVVPFFSARSHSFRTGGWAMQTKRISSRSKLRMDDEVARPGIKEELTTRDEYLETRFTKLSASGYDLTPLIQSEIIELSEPLTKLQKKVMFQSVMETASSGEYTDHKEKGLYVCALDGIPLFSSGIKLQSQNGFAEFFETVDKEHIIIESEMSNGGKQKQVVRSARSSAFLGYMIEDRTTPSNQRFCINSASLKFHALGKPLPVISQPENYWGSEGQYKVW